MRALIARRELVCAAVGAAAGVELLETALGPLHAMAPVPIAAHMSASTLAVVACFALLVALVAALLPAVRRLRVAVGPIVRGPFTLRSHHVLSLAAESAPPLPRRSPVPERGPPAATS